MIAFGVPPKELIIAITGLHAAGKTTVASVFAKLGYPVLGTGDVVRDEVRARNLLPTAENLGAVSLEFLRSRQHEILLRLRNPILASLRNKGTVVIEGIKTPLEKAQLGLLAPHLFTIAVLASRQTRLNRLQGRGRPDDNLTSMSLLLRDTWELEHGLGTLIATSDFFIVSESSIENLIEVSGNIETTIRNEVSGRLKGQR